MPAKKLGWTVETESLVLLSVRVPYLQYVHRPRPIVGVVESFDRPPLRPSGQGYGNLTHQLPRMILGPYGSGFSEIKERQAEASGRGMLQARRLCGALCYDSVASFTFLQCSGGRHFLFKESEVFFSDGIRESLPPGQGKGRMSDNQVGRFRRLPFES